MPPTHKTLANPPPQCQRPVCARRRLGTPHAERRSRPPPDGRASRLTRPHIPSTPRLPRPCTGHTLTATPQLYTHICLAKPPRTSKKPRQSSKKTRRSSKNPRRSSNRLAQQRRGSQQGRTSLATCAQTYESLRRRYEPPGTPRGSSLMFSTKNLSARLARCKVCA